MNRTIEELAQAEATASLQRGKADAQWRAAWWELTLALGALPKRDPEWFATIQRIISITRQAEGTIKNRRALGARVINLGMNYADTCTLPPRMVQAIPLPEFTAETLGLAREAEAEGMSLREFSAMLTGREWSDTAAGASADRIAETLDKATPEVIEAALGKLPDETNARIRNTADQVDADNRNRKVIAKGGKVNPPPTPRPEPLDGTLARIAAFREVETALRAGRESIEAFMLDFGELDDHEQAHVRMMAVGLLDAIEGTGDPNWRNVRAEVTEP